MVPLELQQLNQWTYSIDPGKLRYPRHSDYKANGRLSFKAAKLYAEQHRLSYGVYVTKQDSYIIGDVDGMGDPEDVECLPEALSTMIWEGKFYCQASPSGEGLRLICKLPKGESKESLGFKSGASIRPRHSLENMPGRSEGENKGQKEIKIQIGAPWMRMTEETTTYSPNYIPEVSIAELAEVFKMPLKQDTPTLASVAGDSLKEIKAEMVPAKGEVPSMQQILMALKSIPLDQNPRIQRAFTTVFGVEYSHYDFWLKVMMGMHDYVMKTGVAGPILEAVDRWSASDEENYKGPEDVMDKWKSFEHTDENVSYHTVFALAWENNLYWPKPRKQTKEEKDSGVIKRTPMNTEFLNFMAMMEFYNMKIYTDANNQDEMYVTGDADIIQAYFESHYTKYYFEEYRGVFDIRTLSIACHIMAQDKGFTGLSVRQVNDFILAWNYRINTSIDMVKMFFDTPWDELPPSYRENAAFYDVSTVEHLFECLTIEYLTADPVKERALYYRYYKSWLMGIARGLWWRDAIHMNNCILLLTGRESIRKTSHFRYVLPKFMREDRIASTMHGFNNEGNMRDITKLATQHTLIFWDEIEQYLTRDTESNFKKIIDNNPQKIIDKYQTLASNFKPISIYGATSNKREFKLSNSGSRRIFHIPVTWVDTDRMDKINWHKLMNDLKHEMENSGEAPWLLTEDELEYQDHLHSMITAKSNVDIILQEMYAFDSPCVVGDTQDVVDLKSEFDFMNSPHAMTIKEVTDAISLYTQGALIPKRAELTKALESHCGRWTHTSRKTRAFMQPKFSVFKGHGMYKNRHQRWFMPNRRPGTNPFEPKGIS